MIRWSFVLTRLIVVIAVVVLLSVGLGPVARFVSVRGLESATGAKVEVADANVWLFPSPQVQFINVAIADPREDKELRDAFRADSIELVIDGPELLKRRWIASHGKMAGVQIGARRETTGHFEPAIDAEPESQSDEPSILSRLLGTATDQVREQASDFTRELETVRRSKEIRARWESDYQQLVAKAAQLETQIRHVRDHARGIENPLRDWAELERTLARAREVRNELLRVRQEIDALPQQFQGDLKSLDQAKQIDLAKVDQYVPGNLSNPGEFGIDILADGVRRQIGKIKTYLDHGRTLANYTVIKPKADKRVRGVNYDLNQVQRPSILIRQCEVSGFLRADGHNYEITGRLNNLTPTPEWLEEPTRARLRLEGPEVLIVDYTRDRRQGADVDTLTLRWPQTIAKPLRIGKANEAGIAIEGGAHELWVTLTNEAGALRGELISKRTGVQMRLDAAPSIADTTAAQSLQASLAAVQNIEIDAHFQGSWNDLELSLETNLSRTFRDAAQRAIAGQIRESRARLAASVEKAHVEQTTALRAWLANQQVEARSLLTQADKSIEEMSQKVLDEVGNADAYLGKLRSAIRGGLK